MTILSDPQLQERCRTNSIKHCRLVGSRATHTEREESDVDLVYELDLTIPQTSFQFFSALTFLRDQLNKPIDMINIHHIDHRIASSTLAHKIQIW